MPSNITTYGIQYLCSVILYLFDSLDREILVVVQLDKN